MMMPQNYQMPGLELMPQALHSTTGLHSTPLLQQSNIPDHFATLSGMLYHVVLITRGLILLRDFVMCKSYLSVKMSFIPAPNPTFLYLCQIICVFRLIFRTMSTMVKRL